MTDADITGNMAKLRERARIAARSSGREAGTIAVLAAGKARFRPHLRRVRFAEVSHD